MKKQKEAEGASFISDVRREQIIKATILSLDKVGFVGTSLAVIAKQANISTALISYHFKDKSDLIDNTLIYLVEKSITFVTQRIEAVAQSEQKLEQFIMAQLEYHSSNVAENIALIEIIFHSRTHDGIPYYKIDDNEEEPMKKMLRQILNDVRRRGVFKKVNSEVVIDMVQGAISEYTFRQVRNIPWDKYGRELVKIMLEITKHK